MQSALTLIAVAALSWRLECFATVGHLQQRLRQLHPTERFASREIARTAPGQGPFCLLTPDHPNRDWRRPPLAERL